MQKHDQDTGPIAKPLLAGLKSNSHMVFNREIERMLKALEKQNSILSQKIKNANGSSKKDKSPQKS